MRKVRERHRGLTTNCTMDSYEPTACTAASTRRYGLKQKPRVGRTGLKLLNYTDRAGHC